jgi:hypothetical protein
MRKIIAYFIDLLLTLKSIERHLAILSSTVSKGDGGRSRPSLRTGKNHYDM